MVANDTRSMVVEAVVPNPDGTLRPGLFATAELQLAEQETGVFVPLGAVQKVGEVARGFRRPRRRRPRAGRRPGRESRGKGGDPRRSDGAGAAGRPAPNWSMTEIPGCVP